MTDVTGLHFGFVYFVVDFADFDSADFVPFFDFIFADSTPLTTPLAWSSPLEVS
jgi:hypothetical protein